MKEKTYKMFAQRKTTTATMTIKISSMNNENSTMTTKCPAYTTTTKKSTKLMPTKKPQQLERLIQKMKSTSFHKETKVQRRYKKGRSKAYTTYQVYEKTKYITQCKSITRPEQRRDSTKCTQGVLPLSQQLSFFCYPNNIFMYIHHPMKTALP